MCILFTFHTTFLSVDDLIANRRKQEKSKPNKVGLTKTVSNSDKAIATSRAKRQAHLDARRGISKSSKPTKKQVDDEIKKQVAKKKSSEEQAKKKRVDVNADPATKASLRRQKRELARSGAATIVSGNKKVVGTLGRPPSKKAIRAAVDAMADKGFKIPQGYRMVISFAPDESADSGGAPAGDSKPAAKGDGGKKGGKKKGGKK